MELGARSASDVAARLPAGPPLAVDVSPDALLCETVVALLLDHPGLLGIEITEPVRP